uniref:AMP-dependent synthetase/ligase domain-containing protein n=1 Tax=Amphimedon queenslandica TaxID=400682 RepID=A0A1X7TKJ6_AMPQE
LPLLWTYSQLTERTISLSCILRTLLVPTALEGLRPFVIGLYAYNTPSTLAAILSILSLPAGYCPIRSGPPKRVWSQLQEGRVGVVLVQIHLIQEFINEHESWLIANNWKPSTLLIEYDFVVFFSPVGDWFSYQEETRSHTTCTGTKICRNCTESIPSLTKSNQISHLNLTPPKNSINNDGCGPESYPIVTGLAYLVHTTGTTGSPKGVWVPHCCIVPNVIDLCERFDVRENDRVFNASPLTFDPSVVEIFLSLYSGATLLLVPPVIKSSPLLFSHVVLRSRHVTLLQATPTLIRRLPSDVLREELLGAWSSLRVLAFGGEACPSVKTLREWKSNENKTRLFNIYGITEVSSWASCHEIDIHDSAYNKPHPLGVPIGEPLLGTQIELRGNELKRVFIGGDYRVCCLGNEEFLVQGTFRDSGDDGMTDEHGRIYLCGRSDRQIKRNGHRINLDYIEQVISSLDLVRLCCVVERRGMSDVVAVVVPTVIMAVDRTRRLLFEGMRGCLCDNEIPDQILLVEEIPANIHGKIDINSISIPQSFPSSIDISSLTLQKWRDLILESVSIATGNVTMTTSKGIKLSELGVSSFELLRSVYQLEEHLSSFKDDHKESLLSQIFEIFLTRPLDEAIATTFKFVTLAPPPEASGYHGNSVIGVKRSLSEKEREGPIKRTRRLMNDLKWFRRGLMFDNGRIHYVVYQGRIQGGAEGA